MVLMTQIREEREENQKIYVGVEVYQLIVEDVHLFKTPVEAEKWFESLTGEPYDVFYGEGLNELSDYDGTKIFEVILPEWLNVKNK